MVFIFKFFVVLVVVVMSMKLFLFIFIVVFVRGLCVFVFNMMIAKVKMYAAFADGYVFGLYV